MQKWLQDANIPSKVILDSEIGYASSEEVGQGQKVTNQLLTN